MTVAYEIQTVCECQALLGAELSEDRQVLRGWTSRGGARESAPANSVGADADRFDVVWHCSMCGRNTLRTFHVGALRKRPSVPDPSAPEPAEQGAAEEGGGEQDRPAQGAA